MSSVIQQVAELHEISRSELKDRWRTLFGSEPPNYSGPMMVQRLAYRIQELAYGGLSASATETLDRLLDGERLDEDGPVAARKARSRRRKNTHIAGTRLVREWNGKRCEVTVLRGGKFEYDGKPFTSLTAVAKAITGTHRNGHRFFGLRDEKVRSKAS